MKALRHCTLEKQSNPVGEQARECSPPTKRVQVIVAGAFHEHARQAKLWHCSNYSSGTCNA